MTDIGLDKSGDNDVDTYFRAATAAEKVDECVEQRVYYVQKTRTWDLPPETAEDGLYQTQRTYCQVSQSFV